MWGRCREVCWKVRKDVWGVEKCGRVYGVSGKCVGLWGKDVGKGMGRCREVCLGVGPQHTSCHTSPHLLPHLIPSPFPTSPLTYPTPQHIFLLSPHPPSPSQGVAKLPCDEVSVVKLLATYRPRWCIAIVKQVLDQSTCNFKPDLLTLYLICF